MLEAGYVLTASGDAVAAGAGAATGATRAVVAAADVVGAKSFIGLSAADVALDPGALLFQFLHSAGVAARASAFYLLIQALDLLAIIRDPGLLVPENLTIVADGLPVVLNARFVATDRLSVVLHGLFPQGFLALAFALGGLGLFFSFQTLLLLLRICERALGKRQLRSDAKPGDAKHPVSRFHSCPPRLLALCDKCISR